MGSHNQLTLNEASYDTYEELPLLKQFVYSKTPAGQMKHFDFNNRERQSS